MLLCPVSGMVLGQNGLTAGAVGGGGRTFCWSVCLSFGVKTKQDASVFRCRIHIRARPRRVPRPQFCLMGSFLPFFFFLLFFSP